MATCETCGAELQPEWKFCIACGAPVDVTRPRPPKVPSAIRPEPPIHAEPAVDTAERPRTRMALTNVPLILGVALGLGGIVLIGYLIFTFGG